MKSLLLGAAFGVLSATAALAQAPPTNRLASPGHPGWFKVGACYAWQYSPAEPDQRGAAATGPALPRWSGACGPRFVITGRGTLVTRLKGGGTATFTGVFANGQILHVTVDEAAPDSHCEGAKDAGPDLLITFTYHCVYTNGNSQQSSGRIDAAGHSNGHTVVSLSNGAVYDGDLTDGQLTGTGTESFPTGDHYAGTFLAGHLNGVGTYSWRNGNVYVGTFLAGQRTGEGVETFASGARYEGSFLNGNAQGQGTYNAPDGEVYSGFWSGGCFSEGSRWAVVGPPTSACGR